MQHDKKNNAGKIRFSLLASIGNARHGFEASTTEIEKALNMYLTDVSHH
jgi:3-dehydroquinate synthetase